VLLDQHWTFKLNPAGKNPQAARQEWNYPLCLVSRTGQDMVSFARSLVEWMGGIVREAGTDDMAASLDGKKKKRKQRQFTNVMSEYGALDFG
jgi:cleavage and polyadenylation specificity factor subunit 2